MEQKSKVCTNNYHQSIKNGFEKMLLGFGKFLGVSRNRISRKLTKSEAG